MGRYVKAVHFSTVHGLPLGPLQHDIKTRKREGYLYGDIYWIMDKSYSEHSERFAQLEQEESNRNRVHYCCNSRRGGTTPHGLLIITATILLFGTIIFL